MRRQLPVYSPLSPGSIVRSAAAALVHGRGERSALEEDLRGRFGAEGVCLTASGTHALRLALENVPSIGGRGRVVALPGYSCYDLVTASVGAGVTVRFYDIDPVTLSPDPDSLRRVLSAGVSAVVAANLYGYPLDWEGIEAACEASGVPLIEDAAQGIGTVADRGRGGTLGAATVLSFGRGKGWTGGGGGALLLRGDARQWRDRLTLEPARAHGVRTGIVTTAAWALGRPLLYRAPTSIPALGLGETRYREPTPPRAIAAFSAALARRTANASTAAIDRRRQMAGRLLGGLAAMAGDPPRLRGCEPPGGPESATFLRLPVLSGGPDAARRIVAAGRDLGIAAGYPVALHRLPQSRPLIQGEPAELPGSDALSRSLITLPTHQWIDDREVAAILALLADRRIV